MINEKDLIYLRKGDKVTESGELSVIKGYIECTTSDKLICFIGPGSVFLTSDRLNFSNAIVYEAKCDAILLETSGIESNDSFNTEKKWHDYILMQIFSKFEILYLPAKERLLNILFQIANDIGHHVVSDCYIPGILVQRELAEYANCTREYLSTIRKELVSDGWIANSKQWVLLDWKRWQQEFGMDI
ncbi:Crp/Fnr family transcriptional regulator [Listeria booriae]|uniref:Crp/Fnr family transcriptional regulator n=1 Tax=Listeria booriae TaxID=1552123 RepID=UPI001627C69B|nr:Crp/Fnr family transcriptional regulator [Listeria booriae]MBC1804498.1 Crp/Fnr family transcriptional regulator [Listeria booriae]MDT0111233.1 Crp/Fnr family transcriptional regulator [Listeria booriae]